MPSLIVTILEPSVERALAAVASLPSSIDGVEIRVDSFGSRPSVSDLQRFRNAVTETLIITKRSRDRVAAVDRGLIDDAISAGFDFVDVEFDDATDYTTIGQARERIILSHHDFDAVPSLSGLIDRMVEVGCAKTKIAVTPRNFDENVSILSEVEDRGMNSFTLFGMGATGLYSRILAPFVGSELIFVARDRASIAAPGQLTLEQGQSIYGKAAEVSTPSSIFAVVGSPANHSLSPSIHNAVFREKQVSAAYSILETDDFRRVADALQRAEKMAPRGLSITSPFKEDAYQFAVERGAVLTPRASECRSINTLARLEDGRLFADNTDVDGFTAALRATGIRSGHSALVLGAGGTARAAMKALSDAGVKTHVHNRSVEKSSRLAEEFGSSTVSAQSLADVHCDVIVNTLPSAAGLAPELFKSSPAYIELEYGNLEESEGLRAARERGVNVFTGVEFLHAQAVSQSELFVRLAAASGEQE